MKHLTITGERLEQGRNTNLNLATHEAIGLSRSKGGKPVVFQGCIIVLQQRRSVTVTVRGTQVSMTGDGAQLGLRYWRLSSLSQNLQD